MTTLHFDDADVRRLLPLETLLPAMRRALVDLSAGRVVQPLRSVLDIPAEQGFLFLKPALTGDARLAVDRSIVLLNGKKIFQQVLRLC